MAERTFPILAGRHFQNPGVPIPWAMIAPHERQARANHSQSLEQLAQRGGLSPNEALAVLEDRRWQPMDHDVAERLLRSKIETWRNLNDFAKEP